MASPRRVDGAAVCSRSTSGAERALAGTPGRHARTDARSPSLSTVLAAAPARAVAADESTAWMTNPRHDNQLTGSPLAPPLAVRWDVRLGRAISNVLVADGRVDRGARGCERRAAAHRARGADGRLLWSVATASAQHLLRRRPRVRDAGDGRRRLRRRPARGCGPPTCRPTTACRTSSPTAAWCTPS